jgi:hypothetical protein
MAYSTFRGPLRAGPPLNVGEVQMVRLLDLPAINAATADYQLTLPPCRLLDFVQMTTTAYTGATVALSLGTTLGGAEIVAALDIKALGQRVPPIVAAGAALMYSFTGGILYARIAQGTPTAVGLGRLFARYIALPDSLAA